MRSKRLFGSIALVAALALPGASRAATIDLVATIDGPQADAGAGTGSLGTGSATMTLLTLSNAFSWNISWAGLSGPATFAHFHGPANPNQNAGVQVGIDTASPAMGATILSPAQVADLLAGLWYINIHTEAEPGGEIRGQVLLAPEPSTLLMLLAGGGLLVCMRGVARFGPAGGPISSRSHGPL